MSIIIHFNTASFIPSSVALPSAPYVSRTKSKLAMVPGIDETDQTVMTDDESSMVDIATSNTLYTHAVNDLQITNHALGSCFGLPYQDHNYGAPPPLTPPSYSPCASPAHANGVPDEDTNLSVVSTSTTNEEVQEGSITRCICGFEHDDEYMICCDHCLVWQHVDCMGLDQNNIPDTYLCEKCQPRKVDKHKAKVLQTRKKVAMTDSSESDDEVGVKNADRKQRSRKRKRKEGDEKLEVQPGRKSKQIHKHTKVRIQAKCSKLRRTKNKESTSTADEEAAQDAWEISLEWCEKNYETALNNQYTPEIQLLVKSLPHLGNEDRIMELLLTKNCRVINGNQKKLISIYDIPRNQPLIGYKGKFLLASQFFDLHPAFSKRLFPYVMFYTVEKEDICIDASIYGNEARFIRRSCKPNAELRHLVYKGNLHMYVSSTKAVFKDDEITLPLDFTNLKESIKDIECACESEECPLKFRPKNGSNDISQEKKRKGKKINLTVDEDSSHSFHGSNASPTKCKPVFKNPSQSQSSETAEGKSDHETEEQANERKKKTREERKIDAIMRAFDQMEKAAKRRAQALERQKAHHPKSEEVSENSENMNTLKEEDKVTTASGSETQGGEEEKPVAQKAKKGKRRRASNTPTRRRTRTNSGCSDIISLEESAPTKQAPALVSDPISSTDSVVETSSASTTLTNPVLTTTLTSAPTSPVMLKTKRFLLHEWLQEKSETTTIPTTTSPVSIRTEVKWNTTAASPTCYVQCTKDNSHSGGISAAHLRRSSTLSQIKSVKASSEQGSAKKRWLRQAMFDNSSYEEPLTIDPNGIEGFHFDNGYLSPTGQGELSSPGAVDGTVTPLKKRRLMRESVESISSPLSPTIQSSECAVNASLTFLNIQVKAEAEDNESNKPSLISEGDSSKSLFVSKEDTPCQINGHELSRKSSTKEELNTCETEPSVLIMPKCKVSTETLNLSSSNCKETESSMQYVCDHSGETNDTKTDDKSSVNLCSEEKCETMLNAITGTKEDSDVVTNERDIHCDVVEHSLPSFKSDCSITKNDINGEKSKKEVKHKLENVNIVYENNPVQSITESVTSSCSSVISKCFEQDVNVSLDFNDDCILPKTVVETSAVDSEVTYGNNSSDDANVNHGKAFDFSTFDSKSSELSNESSSSTRSACASATQKRKVSLSEYRLRMKDGSNKRANSEDLKKSTNSPTTSVVETFPEQVTLAPLPLFDKTDGSTSPSETVHKTPKSNKGLIGNEQDSSSYSDLTEHRENLTERLKREFGFDDDDDSEGTMPALSHAKSSTESIATSFCAQLPPPPPPPRPIKSSQTNINVASVTSPQFSYSLPTQYARPPYMVPQVPGAQFIPVQQTMNTPIMSSVHQIATPGVQCSVRPPLLPSPHSFASSLSGTSLQPLIQHEYSSVNAQNYATLVQQPPPPTSYPHVYQQGLYK